MTILDVRNLFVNFTLDGVIYSIVEDLSFSLHQGQTLALVGESGCGKTMAALSLLRILPNLPGLSLQGEVVYRNENLLLASESTMRSVRGSRIAMIFQDPSTALNPVFTIGNQILEVARIHLTMSEEEARNKAIQALEEVGIPSAHEILEKYPHQLSGGMKQRVMIAMALFCQPDILIADEPTTALDVTIQAQVLKLMRELQEKKGMAILLITHDMGVVAEMANDVMVMYASQIVERGNVFKIFDAMSHPYTIGLFNSRPRIDDPKATLSPIKGYVPSLTQYPSGCRFHPRCPYVMEKCKQGSVPDFVIAGDSTHKSKCWLHDGTEESKQKIHYFRT